LKLFYDMKHGKFKEGEATLRLKMDMQSPNPCMRDVPLLSTDSPLPLFL
jgi:glutaminyl-tRNA synthetase